MPETAQDLAEKIALALANPLPTFEQKREAEAALGELMQRYEELRRQVFGDPLLPIGHPTC